MAANSSGLSSSIGIVLLLAWLIALTACADESAQASASATGGADAASGSTPTRGSSHDGGSAGATPGGTSSGGAGATSTRAAPGGTSSGSAGASSGGVANAGGGAAIRGTASGGSSPAASGGAGGNGGNGGSVAGSGGPMTGGARGQDASAPVCVTSEPKGICGPYRYARNTGSDGTNTEVDQNVWNPIPGWSQTLYATDPGNWHVTASMPAGNTGVVSFANTWQKSLPSPNKLTDFSSIYSSFSENGNVTAETSAGWGYDIWLNAWADEVMIQHDNVKRGSCDDIGVLATATFGGAGGVPKQDWNLCKNGSEIIWQPVKNGAYLRISSGTVDILAMLRWLMDHGHLPQGSVLDNGISWGVEICSTGGRVEDFEVQDFSITAAR